MIRSRMHMVLLLIGTVALVACAQSAPPRPLDLSKATTQELIGLLQNPADSEGVFEAAVAELTARGPAAVDAAPALAKALAYNRRDSTLAGVALIAMGPAAREAVRALAENLYSPRPDVRRYSAFALGIIGTPSQCAVPTLATLLWDSDGGVRTASAAAIQAITSNALVEDSERLDPSLPGSVPWDEPNGSISGRARAWWLHEGRNSVWPTRNCTNRP